MKKLNYVLLIDQDEASIMYNRLIISKLDITSNIHEVKLASDAFEFLSDNTEENHSQNGAYGSGLIFLDLSKHRIGGIQFLEAFDRLPATQKLAHITIMLSDTMTEKERNYVQSFNSVKGIVAKPLSAAYVSSLVTNYFYTLESSIEE